MRATPFLFFLGLIFFLAGAICPCQENDLTLKKGEIIDPLFCQEDPSQSYALYLPSHYSDDKEWPVIYIFDPAARGNTALSVFQKGAETYGYILVCSNNSRNGPLEPVIEAAQAVWKDTHDRFSIDDDRIYASGFSGGSRVASLFSSIILMPVEGIIGCGAGLGSSLKAENIKPSFYYGIVGLEDFNYQEMFYLDEEFDVQGILHRIRVFQGEHDWPPPAVITEALGWMELAAMKRGLLAENEVFVKNRLQMWLAEVHELEEDDRYFSAVREYRAMADIFHDLTEIEKIQNKIELLRATSEYKKDQKLEQKRNSEEYEMFSVIDSVLAKIKTGELTGLSTISSKLGLKRLQRKSMMEQSALDRSMARRLLSTIGVDSQRLGGMAYQEKDYQKAILFFMLSSEVHRNSTKQQYDLYYLARMYAVTGDKDKALDFLMQAVEKGFDDISAIAGNHDFDILKDSLELAKILERLEKRNDT